MRLFWVSPVHHRVSGFFRQLVKSEENPFTGKLLDQMNPPRMNNCLSSVQPHEVRIAGTSAILRIFWSCGDCRADHQKAIFEEHEPFFMSAEC
jgi:hypothetical protein